MKISFELTSLLVLIPLFILSVLAVFFIVERLLFFHGTKKQEANQFDQIRQWVKRGAWEEAKRYCEENPSSFSSLVLVVLENRYLSKEELREQILCASNLETPKIERFLSALGTISHIAPLLGLLGTVTGNIKAFGLLGEGGNQQYEQLAPAIAEALYTTAIGMMVAIPTIIFYNYFVGCANERMAMLEYRIEAILSMMRD